MWDHEQKATKHLLTCKKVCLDLHLQELKQAISSIPSPCTSQTPSQQNNAQCSKSLHTQRYKGNSIPASTKESLFLRNCISCLCWAFHSVELSRLLFISICLGSRQFPSSPQPPTFMEFTVPFKQFGLWETWLEEVIWSRHAPKQQRAVADTKTQLGLYS